MKRDLPPERMVLLRPDDLAGLDEARVAELRSAFGANQVAEYPAKKAVELARDVLSDAMVWFLTAVAIVFLIVGETADAVIMLAAIVPLVAMDFFLHRRTEASIKGLRSVLASQACVVRAGEERQIAAAEVVTGDLARVSAGEAFPADGIILAGSDLQVDESSLTGEAYPVRKQPLGHDLTARPAEAQWAFAGTRLLTGEARMRVLYTGSDTLYGEIVKAATHSSRERTPLQQEVMVLVLVLVLVAAGVCLTLAAVRLWQGYGWIDAFMSAAVLAMAAIPEEFPVVLTFFLARGVYRLAQRQSLVRHPTAVENIGRVEVICSDKTGTITEGMLALQDVRPCGGATAQQVLACGRMASRSDTHDPLDQALLAASEPLPEARLLATFPFTEARRREVAIWDRGGRTEAVAKGAPEAILAMCDMDADAQETVRHDLASMTQAGRKVIACASRAAVSASGEPDHGFALLGLIGVADPVRQGARDAIEQARSAGIRVIMVTGDHLQTALAIAREAGLAEQPAGITGDEFEAQIASGERDFLQDLTVVARASPAQKVMLVEAVRESGRVTAVTGDGVNDVPALKAASVGIAMGLRGTRSAREVASIILLDDNFRTIIAAIAEGRQLFRNLARSFAYLLMVHIPLVATAAIIPLLGYPLLYLPIHIVLLELLIHPAAILAFQRDPDGRWTGAGWQAHGFFGRGQKVAIGLAGLAITACVFGLFIASMQAGEAVDHARTMGVLALIAALATLLAILTRLREREAAAIFGCTVLLVIAIAAVPQVAGLLHLHVLDAADMALAVAAGVLGAAPSILFDSWNREGRKGNG